MMVLQTATAKVYPIVAPVADPAIETVTPYYQAAVDHLKPQPAPIKKLE